MKNRVKSVIKRDRVDARALSHLERGRLPELVPRGVTGSSATSNDRHASLMRLGFLDTSACRQRLASVLMDSRVSLWRVEIPKKSPRLRFWGLPCRRAYVSASSDEKYPV